jgi:outer membrane protein OmpA-like peptidoglycan-associated protein
MVNTADKENFPFITEDNTLYFATTGRQGFGGFDVYEVNLNGSESPQNLGRPLNSEKDDFSLSFNKNLNIGYFSSNRNGSDAIFSATPLCKAEAIVFVTNSKTKMPLADAYVTILDLNGDSIVTRKTNAEGKVSYPIECTIGYGLQVAAQNFEKVAFPLSAVKSGVTNIEVALEPSSVIITDTEVILKSIYFEYDKSNITAQGANELDKLVKVMKENPTMVIFVKSHTDSKGKSSYNLKLSEQRAQSTVQYLLSKGVTKDRISGKGYGNTELKIKCTSCTEEEDTQNRRSEFLIVKK